MTTETTKPARPLLTVLGGNPSDSEVAALTVLFASMAANAQAQAQDDSLRERNMWGNYTERLNRPTTYNPTAFHNVSFY